MNKLYCAKTKSGHILIRCATLDYLETKFEFTLNDLVEAEHLQRGEVLSRRLRIKTTSELYNSLYSSDKGGYYSVSIECEN